MNRFDTTYHSQGRPTSCRIVFLHHSTGRRLIRQGRIREILDLRNEESRQNHEFWDHDYNRIGLTDAKGRRVGISYRIPNDNTDPDGLEVLFCQDPDDPTTALGHLLQFDVVAFKSCFPVSAIKSDAQFVRYQEHYLAIRSVLDLHPRILFVVMTPPPLIPLHLPVVAPAWTNKDDAKRARRFARWLSSTEFVGAKKNVVVFDFFDRLALQDGDSPDANMLRKEYRGLLGLDSHPNKRANKAIGPVFVDFLLNSISSFHGGAP